MPADALLAEFLFVHLVLSPQVLDDFLLLAVHPAGKITKYSCQGCRMKSMIGLKMR